MFRSAALLALLAAAAPALAQSQRYELDPVHTRVMFAVSHAGFSNALGTISGSTGTLVFDPAGWEGAQVEVEVPLAKLDLGDPDWNAAALGRRLLDARTHPTAGFVSTSVEPRDPTHARVCGDLTLRGATAPLCLEVTLNAMKRHPMPPFRRTIGFSATGTLDRSRFGIDAWNGLIGDTVELRIEAEMVRRRHRGSEPEAAEQEDAAPQASELQDPELQDPEPQDPEPDPGAETGEPPTPDPTNPGPASAATRPTPPPP